MRLVIDTNVLIAAFIARGASQQLLEHCVRHHTVVVSSLILDELREKLIVKFKYPVQMADEAVRLLESRMERIIPAPLAAPVCRDADDDNILAAALTGNCECIVTGDKDLLVLRQFNSINILNPADFLKGEGIE